MPANGQAVIVNDLGLQDHAAAIGTAAQNPEPSSIQNSASKPTPSTRNATGRLKAKKCKLIKKISGQKEKIADKKDKLRAKAKPPGGFDTTPLPDALPGYTVKFVFHRASNLPAADIDSGAADPYVYATLTTGLPKRHKEDPVLTYRSRTVRRSTEPEWGEEWVVANVPASGFILKCRLFDEDFPDHDDRLGNVVLAVPYLDEGWEELAGSEGHIFRVQKRTGSKRAYFVKSITSALSRDRTMTPLLYLSIRVLGRSDPPYGQMYTLGPTGWIRHYSPMIGRLAGVKVNRDEQDDLTGSTCPQHEQARHKQTKKYDFQANEIQFSGPVPPGLYHRYVEFRPFVGPMFARHGIRGRILNKALHKQHKRIYNFDHTTEHGLFAPCSQEASLQLLKMAHFDEGGRIFTYIITLDGLMRFTETGKEFGIDLLSKHTMHSDVATYIACAGEFFVRRLARSDASENPDLVQPTHPADHVAGGPPTAEPPRAPHHYQLVIDNDSGTYRPDKSVLPDLEAFLRRNLPGLGIAVLHWEDEELQRLKREQADAKRREGRRVNMVLNRSPSASSLSSDDEDRLDAMERHGDDGRGGVEKRVKSKKERALDVLQEPNRVKELMRGGERLVGGTACGKE